MTGLVDLVQAKASTYAATSACNAAASICPGTVADQLVQQRPTHSGRGVLVGLVLLLDYREHGRTFPNQRANAGS